MRPPGFIVATAALAFAGAADAQPSPASPALDDARCILVMMSLANSTDTNAQRFGQDGVAFFTARVAAFDPGFDFTRLKSLAASMDAQAAQTALQQRCGPMLQTTMQKLEAALASPSAPSSAPAPK
jgi:hypothetical protein